MKITIIGAGIAGMIAAGSFTKEGYNDITIIDKAPEPPLTFADHSAVLRMRDPKIKDYVPCTLTEIFVRKEIFYNSKLFTESNIRLNNLYSIKTHNALEERSLGELGWCKRFNISGVKMPVGVKYRSASITGIEKKLLLGIEKKLLFFDRDFCHEYDICISTIPMPTLIGITNYWDKITPIPIFSFEPIYIYNYDVDIRSSVSQTIYFPDPEDPQYRATLEGQKLIIESMDKDLTLSDMSMAFHAFGLRLRQLKSKGQKTQQMGKITPIDDLTRRRIMVDLTNNFNIYSFGRYATWRSLRVDQILGDIEKIKMLIRVGNKNYYPDLKGE